MAQYKVIQDIEAEDKLLGPLTLKQFIYAAITITLGFIAFKLATGLHSPYIIIIFLPEMLFFGVLAAPFGIDQPNEIWLLAKFRFFLKPQIRKWDQDGIGSLVTITVPKKLDKKLTKDFTATEAKGRLEALAKILDTGGWASPLVGPTTFKSNMFKTDDDRLMGLSSIISDQPTSDIVDQDDIFDENNLQARHIGSIMSENETKIRTYQKNLVAQPEQPQLSSDQATIIGPASNIRQPKDYLNDAPIQPAFSPIESRFYPEIDPTLNKNSPTVQTPMTTQPDNANISLRARDNNLSIASIERELKSGDGSNEVVIHFH